jgi:hypothetical protein
MGQNDTIGVCPLLYHFLKIVQKGTDPNCLQRFRGLVKFDEKGVKYEKNGEFPGVGAVFGVGEV